MARTVIDGMNVIGSRADGWWRDRDAAALRLLRRLQHAATRSRDALTLVLDGRPPAVVRFESPDDLRKLAGFTPRGPLSLPPGGAHWYALGGLGTPDPQTFAAGYDAAQEWLDGLGA